MRSLLSCAFILVLLCSTAFGKSYDMTVHLSNGETVTLSLDDILRIEFAGIATGASDPADPQLVPDAFQVLGNYPNPFNPSTTIAYEIPAAATVTVRIYDLHGGLIKELVRETQPAGRHEVTWDGTDGQRSRVASGVYIYAVQCGTLALSRQLILVK